MVKFNRVWIMPNKWTFEMKPVSDLLYRYGVGKNWIDPFAGISSPAEITNDLNPKRPTQFHLDAKDFIIQLDKIYSGVLFDPPYSLRQLKECYDSIGIGHVSYDDTTSFPNNIKDLLSPKIDIGGYAISFGWNTVGFGLHNGFELREILILCHGGKHNDTLVTVEQKTQGELSL